MKIIRVSNYNIEYESERLVADVPVENEARIMCDALNEHPDRSDHDYFRVVEDDYKLWRGMEELV